MRSLDITEKRFVALFLLLLAITLFSSEGIGRLAGAGSRSLLLAIMLSLTLVKVRIVVMNFMELRAAPRAGRILANCWIGGLLLGLIMMMELQL